MELRRLGNTGIDVGAVGLGTYRVFNVRGDAEEARCEAVVDRLLDEGGNLIDSSPMYGRSEEVLGNVAGDRRDQVVIATKVWARNRAIADEQISRALEWYEYVDLYQVHNLLDLDEHLPRLRELKSVGKVRSVGVTHYLQSALPELMRLVRDREVEVIQVPYHPLERWVDPELLDEAHRLGVGVIAMTPLGAGSLLSRMPTREELEPLAEFGVHTWPQALIKWALSDERISAVIPATGNPDHMRDNAIAGQGPWFTGDARMYVRNLATRLRGEIQPS
jgi:aryl-alcohol dehydrogenase-like predicted oxidoreductase